MISRINKYMFNLLLTLLGVIGFLINAKELIHIYGLLLVSILFMIAPAALIALNSNNCHLTKTQSLSLVIVPLIFLNYIYYIIMVLPVGFVDVHFHILQCVKLLNSDGIIQFSEQLSYNFVGLYLIFHFLMATSNLDISTLASFIPPLFNLVLIITVYLFVNKLHSHRVALISMMLYGWENQVLLFGHEMRTQTLGVLLLFIALFFEYSNFKKSTSAIILVIILSSSVMSSFVSIFFTCFLFFSMLIISMILYFVPKWAVCRFFCEVTSFNKFLNRGFDIGKSKLHKVCKNLALNLFQIRYITPKRPENVGQVSWGLFGLYFIAGISYLIYVSRGFNNLIHCIVALFNQMMVNTGDAEFTGNQIVKSTGQTMYGNFVQYSTYVFWSLFLLFSILYLLMIINQRKLANLKFFASFGALLFYTFFNTFSGLLSSGRLYSVIFVLIATIIAFGLFQLQDIIKKEKFKCTGKILAISIILLFIISSTIKLPNYIIGDTNPLRSEALIDSVSYWDSDVPQYSVGEFLSSYALNQSIFTYTFVENYFLLQQRMKNSFGKGKLTILHDKFHGYTYTNRNKLPEYQVFEEFDKIYSNTDYIVFRGG